MKTLISISLFLALSVCAFAQPQPMGPYGTIPASTITALPATTSALTARQVVGMTKSTATAAATLTTPTATVLCTLFPFVGASNAGSFNWWWIVRNDSAGANTVTIAGGSGVTISGTATIAQNAAKMFLVNISGCGSGQTPAAVAYSMGSTTF